jgi:branched-subunit amino acid aminotransferase/4-amino-4-deoxychorismate lyase
MPSNAPDPKDPYWWADPVTKEKLQADPAGALRARGINVSPNTPLALIQEVLRITTLLWVDGYAVPVERFHIDPSDEGLLFGKGVWESTRTLRGSPWLWDYHLERMKKTIDILKINVNPDRLPTREQVEKYVSVLTAQDVIIRVNATMGRPGNVGMVWMSAALKPLPMASFRVEKRTSPVFKDHPYLLWKTFNYAGRLHTGATGFAAGFDSSLMVDADDNILEAAHANVFFRFKDGWATPKDDGQFLPGTVREYLLKTQPMPIEEMTIPYSRVPEIEEAFVTNSNVGITPLTLIGTHAIPVGQATQDLIASLGLNKQ